MALQKSIAETILKTIDYVVQERLKKYDGNFVKSVVKSVTSDGKYIVVINGSDYEVPCGIGVKLKSGDHVMVHIPYNNYNNAYISAILN